VPLALEMLEAAAADEAADKAKAAEAEAVAAEKAEEAAEAGEEAPPEEPEEPKKPPPVLPERVVMPDEVVSMMATNYTREAGVRPDEGRAVILFYMETPYTDGK
jgi:hypothetical protein